ncbi:MAG: PadR family transcriptional regulator [Christensenellaceae bacterium]|jgi:DNA-binding PadR family transcriptional regulator|nr:PadR family transcriptional regulator [Christensenellaceae bacterium]
MAVSSDVLRGHTETIILRILSAKDSYGYEITKEIIEAGEGLIDVKDATIYTAFRRMETDGLITTYWGDGTFGARRKYYSITKAGSKLYNDRLVEWKQISRLLNNLIIGPIVN